MKITVTFDSLEEFQQHMTACAPATTTITGDGITIKMLGSEPVEAEPEKLPEEPEKAPEEAKTEITEDFRVEVRKTLAALNKLQAGNPAKALIAETGYKRLTDVPLELLPGLMQKAEEAMNHV